MKNTWVCTIVMLLGIIGLNANFTEAAGPAGWNQKLKCDRSCPRFTVLGVWDDAAVLDKETGLVWEQTPSVSILNWADAHDHCNNLAVSNRMGWRLPTLQELTSLVDTSQANPALPSAHPFNSIANTTYWTATTYAPSTTFAWGLDFSDNSALDVGKASTIRVWCVRGGNGVDSQ